LCEERNIVAFSLLVDIRLFEEGIVPSSLSFSVESSLSKRWNVKNYLNQGRFCVGQLERVPYLLLILEEIKIKIKRPITRVIINGPKSLA